MLDSVQVTSGVIYYTDVVETSIFIRRARELSLSQLEITLLYSLMNFVAGSNEFILWDFVAVVSALFWWLPLLILAFRSYSGLGIVWRAYKKKDLPLPRYLWDIAKSTTKAERLSCAAAIVVLLVCIILIVYFTVIAKKTASVVDVAPHEWYITRDMWLAPPFLNQEDEIEEQFGPLKLVIVAHTVSAECNLFKNCAAELRNLQSYFAASVNYDLPYNFLIGNEGRVYEGRGWNKIGAHTRGYNRCTLGIAFIGDYREGLPSYSKVTELQLKRAKMLLEKGVELGYLDRDYHVLGAKDVQSSYSPGTNLYRAIRQWPAYNHANYYRDKSCEEIYNITVTPTTAAVQTTMKIATGNDTIDT